MDCQTSRFLALGLLALVGCAPLGGKQSTTQPVGQIGFLDDKPLPDVPDEKKRPPQPGTCVAAGDYYAHEAAGQENAPLAQEGLRNQARLAYQQAIREDPNYIPAYQALAALYLAMDDHQHAAATYQRAIQAAPRNHALWFDLGMCYARKKDWNSALPNLSKAVELDPENRQYINILGYTLARAGRYDESLACFTRVQSKAKAHYNLARMLQHMQQTDLCKYHLQLAVQEDAQFEQAQSMLAQLNGGKLNSLQPVNYEEQAPDSQPAPRQSSTAQFQPAPLGDAMYSATSLPRASN